MDNIFTNLAFKSGNAKKLAKVSCDDLLKRIDGLKKIRDKRQQIQDECFKGSPEPGHEDAMNRLDSGINKMQQLAKTACGPSYVP